MAMVKAYSRWFCWLVWIGIAVNLPFGFLGLFAPNTLTSIFGLPQPASTVWVRDAGLFLIFISLFYIPAALDPFRYQFNAYLLVISRLCFAAFWFLGVWLLPDFGSDYLQFG